MTMPEFNAGEVLRDDRMRGLTRPPIARLRQTSVQALANNTSVTMLFQVEDVDSDPAGTGGHSGSSDRWTCVYPGWYLLSGGIGFASNATGFRLASLKKNGGVIPGGDVLLPAASGNITRLPARTELAYFSVGDYAQLAGYQNSGGSLNTSAGGDEQSTLNIMWWSL